MVAQISAETLTACEKVIGYRFQDQGLLVLALTHASMKTAEDDPSNERMEFLGDSVLGLVTAEHLYRIRPDYDEGDCTEVKSAVVSRETLNLVTRRLGLLEFMAMGRGVSRHGSVPVSVGANIYEGVVGAIYLDGGLGHARRFILNSLKEEISSRTGSETVVSNAKSTLQQTAQHRLGASPNYRILREFGSSHTRRFEIAAMIQGREWGRGEGGNKKEAEMRAAEAALKALESGQAPPAPASPAGSVPAEPKAGGRGRGRGRGRAGPPEASAPASRAVVVPIAAPPPSFGAGILSDSPVASEAGGAKPKRRRRRGSRGRGRGQRKAPGGPGPNTPATTT